MALRFNPLLVASLPVGAWVAGKYAWRRLNHIEPGLVIRAFWLWLLLAITVVFGIWRNLPGNPFMFPG
jgi:hypothetical protein